LPRVWRFRRTSTTRLISTGASGYPPSGVCDVPAAGERLSDLHAVGDGLDTGGFQHRLFRDQRCTWAIDGLLATYGFQRGVRLRLPELGVAAMMSALPVLIPLGDPADAARPGDRGAAMTAALAAPGGRGAMDGARAAGGAGPGRWRGTWDRPADLDAAGRSTTCC